MAVRSSPPLGSAIALALTLRACFSRWDPVGDRVLWVNMHRWIWTGWVYNESLVERNRTALP